MMNKIIFAGFAVTSAVLLLAGCGEKAPSPELLSRDIPGILAATVDAKIAELAEENRMHNCFLSDKTELLIISNGVRRMSKEAPVANTPISLARHYDLSRVRFRIENAIPDPVQKNTAPGYPFRTTLHARLTTQIASRTNVAGVTLHSITPPEWDTWSSVEKARKLEGLERLLPDRRFDFAALSADIKTGETPESTPLLLQLYWSAAEKRWVTHQMPNGRPLLPATPDWRQFSDAQLRQEMTKNGVAENKNRWIPRQDLAAVLQSDSGVLYRGQWIAQASVAATAKLDEIMEKLPKDNHPDSLRPLVMAAADPAAKNRDKAIALAIERLRRFADGLTAADPAALLQLEQLLATPEWAALNTPELQAKLAAIRQALAQKSQQEIKQLAERVETARRVAATETPAQADLNVLTWQIQLEEPDARQRLRYLELACCGALLNRDAAFAQTVLDKMTADDKNRLTVLLFNACRTCNAQGASVCNICQGRKSCLVCKGEGQLTRKLLTARDYEDQTFACSRCDGTGHCPTCGGTGQKRCPVCKGNVYSPNRPAVLKLMQETFAQLEREAEAKEDKLRQTATKP